MTDNPFDLGGHRGRSAMWGEPSRTLRDMLLTEPGSKIEGSTDEILECVFASSWYLLREHMPEEQADQLALRLLARIHEDLAGKGYVVRQYPDQP